MNDMPLEPYLQATQADTIRALQEVELGGPAQFWVDATLAVSEALPQGWRELEKVELKQTVKLIWAAIREEAARNWGELAVMAFYLTRTEETQMVLDHFAWVEINLTIEEVGPIRCEQLFEVVGRWRNSDVLVVFAGNARRCEFVSFIRGRESEEVQRMQPCLLRE